MSASGEQSSRPLFRLARDLLARRDASTGSNRESAQSDLDAAFEAIEEQLDAQIAALPPRTLEQRLARRARR